MPEKKLLSPENKTLCQRNENSSLEKGCLTW